MFIKTRKNEMRGEVMTRPDFELVASYFLRWLCCFANACDCGLHLHVILSWVILCFQLLTTASCIAARTQKTEHMIESFKLENIYFGSWVCGRSCTHTRTLENGYNSSGIGGSTRLGLYAEREASQLSLSNSTTYIQCQDFFGLFE